MIQYVIPLFLTLVASSLQAMYGSSSGDDNYTLENSTTDDNYSMEASVAPRLQSWAKKIGAGFEELPANPHTAQSLYRQSLRRYSCDLASLPEGRIRKKQSIYKNMNEYLDALCEQPESQELPLDKNRHAWQLWVLGTRYHFGLKEYGEDLVIAELIYKKAIKAFQECIALTTKQKYTKASKLTTSAPCAERELNEQLYCYYEGLGHVYSSLGQLNGQQGERDSQQQNYLSAQTSYKQALYCDHNNGEVIAMLLRELRVLMREATRVTRRKKSDSYSATGSSASYAP